MGDAVQASNIFFLFRELKLIKLVAFVLFLGKMSRKKKKNYNI